MRRSERFSEVLRKLVRRSPAFGLALACAIFIGCGNPAERMVERCLDAVDDEDFNRAAECIHSEAVARDEIRRLPEFRKYRVDDVKIGPDYTVVAITLTTAAGMETGLEAHVDQDSLRDNVWRIRSFRRVTGQGPRENAGPRFLP